jgi:hypothetical protein
VAKKEKAPVDQEQTDEIIADESVAKPKRRYVRKKAVAEEEEPIRQIDGVEQLEPAAEEKEEVMPEPEGEVIDPGPVDARSIHRHGHGAVHRPAFEHHSRPAHRTVSVPVHKDANFLVPEKFGFDLKEKRAARNAQSRWLKGFLYFLGTLIILTAVALFLVSAYSTNLFNPEPKETATETEVVPQKGTEYALVNIPTNLRVGIAANIKSKFGEDFFLSSAIPTLPQVTVDTIFYAPDAEAKATELQKYLSEAGLNLKMQASQDLSVPVAVYLLTTVAPDLTGLTSKVLNATNTAGLARTNCDTLKTWKVKDCQAGNADENTTGTTVTYKNPKVMYMLGRTAQYREAKYVESTTQTEDINIVVGS